MAGIRCRFCHSEGIVKAEFRDILFSVGDIHFEFRVNSVRDDGAVEM